MFRNWFYIAKSSIWNNKKKVESGDRTTINRDLSYRYSGVFKNTLSPSLPVSMRIGSHYAPKVFGIL